MKAMTVADLIGQLLSQPQDAQVVLALAPGELCEAQPVVELDFVAYSDGMIHSALGSEMDFDTPKDAVPAVALLPLQNMCHEMRYITLKGWDGLSDRDKACVVAYWGKCDTEGQQYAQENYPARFVEDFVLANLTRAEACDYAGRLLCALTEKGEDSLGEGDAFAALGADEWDRLMDIYDTPTNARQ